MRRTKLYPNFPLLVARRLGIRLMYAPPLRHVHHTPIRPLVVRSSLSFPGASLYFKELRQNLRRHFIMDVAQLLSFFPLLTLFSLSMSRLIDDPRWYLISVIPQTCIVVGLTYTSLCRSLYARFANWWMRRFPDA